MVLILMGPSGSGKTTIGVALARHLGWHFCDGDDLHPPANIQRMHAGLPLREEDRRPWLAAVRHEVTSWLRADRPAVLACSALRRSYRDLLRGATADAGRPETALRFLYLHADPAVLEQRLRARTGHFAGVALLPSQLATLEEPGPDEALVLDAAASPEALVRTIAAALHLDPPAKSGS